MLDFLIGEPSHVAEATTTNGLVVAASAAFKPRFMTPRFYPIMLSKIIASPLGSTFIGNHPRSSAVAVSAFLCACTILPGGLLDAGDQRLRALA